MASVPQSVTSATGSTVSACLIRRTAAMAPMADAPQIEKPVATRSDVSARQPEKAGDSVGAGEAGQHHTGNEQQGQPAQAEHVHDADLEAQQHNARRA